MYAMNKFIASKSFLSSSLFIFIIIILFMCVIRTPTQGKYLTKFNTFHNKSEESNGNSSTLVWRIPGMGEPGGLLSMGLHRVGHDWSDLAAAAAQ